METRLKKYRMIRHYNDKNAHIENQTIDDIMDNLKQHNSRTTNYQEFKLYCTEKNNVNRKLFEHYKDFLYRKLKLNAYINTQKSESKMVKNFEKKIR